MAELQTQPASWSRKVAGQAKVKKRHRGILASFCVVFLLPVAITVVYMFGFAADQYSSTVGFTVRKEETNPAADLLGGLGRSLGATSSTDSDILFKYLHSQQLVAEIDAELDLRSIFSEHHSTDPLMTFDPDGTIEDLRHFWTRMLRVSYDRRSGMIELETLAFAPDKARAIAEAVYVHSTKMINALSAQARSDATQYAADDLARAEARARDAREALTAFRIRNQIVDLGADVQTQMGLLATLQSQLADALIEYDLLIGTSREDDPRVVQAQRRIDVIKERIEEERAKFGGGEQVANGEAYAEVVAEFERLSADREFATLTYTAARTAYDNAVAEAQRQSLYLATFVSPTLAEKAEYPRRFMFVGTVALFSLLIWAVGVLVFYSLRDRR